MTREMWRRLVFIAAAGAAAACANPETDEISGPRVYDVSDRQLVVGETLYVYGKNLFNPDAGSTRVRLVGTYVTDTGDQEHVDLTFNTVFEGQRGPEDDPEDVLRLPRLGPFSNPFSSTDRPGAFRGKMIAMNLDTDGALVEMDDDPPDVALEILPSLIIDELQPIDADCGAPALRGLAGIPYRLTVRPVGIKAVRFQYSISHLNGQPSATTFTHAYGAPVADDSAGVDEEMTFTVVPDQVQSYVALIGVIAYDAEGRTVETVIPFSIHRPIEVVFGGKLEVAERYEPVPVSSCIPGAIRSTVAYSETKSETRQQSVSVTVSNNWLQSRGNTTTQNWLDGISNGESTSRSLGSSDSESENSSETYGVEYGESRANDVGFSSATGESWGWNMSEGESRDDYEERMHEMFGEGSYATAVGASAEGSVPGLAKVTGSVETTVGVRAGGKLGGSEGTHRSVSSNRGWSAGGNSDESRSFGSTTTDSQSQSLSGSYALSRSRNRSENNTAARSEGRTWSFGEGIAQNQTVSEGMSESEAQTWVNSQTDSSTQSFAALLPNGKVGIFYRQTTRWVRRAEVRTYNLCGVARHQGELQFNEWTWGPDLAVGDDCATQPPPPNLPPAQCFVSPCGG